jgi:predicted amidohydrolase
MRVGVVQFKATKGDLTGSLDRLVALATQAAVGADLVVLPEMAATGYCFPSREAVEAIAEPADGPTARALSAVARQAGCWLVVGFPEAAGDLLYNSALVLDPTGETAFVYRKTLLYDADVPWATPGDSGYPLLECAGVCFTVGICMDLNDDAFRGWLLEARPRVLAFPTNWISEGVSVWPYLAWRMLETGTALVAANSYGPDGEVEFTGESVVIDGLEVLGAAPVEGDGYFLVDIPDEPSPAPAE